MKIYTIECFIIGGGISVGLNFLSDGKFSSRGEPKNFETEAEARAVYDTIDADFMIRDGFRDYASIKIYLVEYSTGADGEVIDRVIADKSLTVDLKKERA